MTMQNVLQLDKNVHYGEIVRHSRKDLKCRVSSLVEIYNETFGTDYSQRWWERMEKDDKLPTDVDRRLVIAAMLQIPLANLGIRLPQTQKKQLLIPFLTGKTVIDVPEYRNHLAGLWSSKYAEGPKMPYIGSICWRMLCTMALSLRDRRLQSCLVNI